MSASGPSGPLVYLFIKVAFDQGMHCLHQEYSIKI